MSRRQFIASHMLIYSLVLALGRTNAIADSVLEKDAFYQHVMMAPALVPQDTHAHSLNCKNRTLPEPERALYKTAAQAAYDEPGWERRIAADWHFFEASQTGTRLLVIDFANIGNGKLAYRYFANAASQHELYEPWSSSKIMAISAAMGRLRAAGLGGNSRVGEHNMADLVTSIHTYAPSGQNSGDSNAIANFLVNFTGRRRINALFHNAWLNLPDSRIRLSGAFSAESFQPHSRKWTFTKKGISRELPLFEQSQDDPVYQPYRCEQCGQLGNKPMSTLAQAEWLKRLASHTREASTRQPFLQTDDIHTLFFAPEREDKQLPIGGMMAGIGRLLPQTLAVAIDPESGGDTLASLGAHAGEDWRIYQKMGWGYSETRSAGEVVLLAHICLPALGDGREFTLAAQSSVAGDDEIQVSAAGKKLQKTLQAALSALLARDGIKETD